MSLSEAAHLPHFLDLCEAAPEAYEEFGLIPVTPTYAAYATAHLDYTWTIILSAEPFVTIAPKG